MALLLCERQQNWLRVVTVVFRTIGIYVITSTFYVFYVFFKIQKVATFYVFLPCFVRFLELCVMSWTERRTYGQIDRIAIIWYTDLSEITNDRCFLTQHLVQRHENPYGEWRHGYYFLVLLTDYNAANVFYDSILSDSNCFLVHAIDIYGINLTCRPNCRVNIRSHYVTDDGQFLRLLPV